MESIKSKAHLNIQKFKIKSKSPMSVENERPWEVYGTCLFFFFLVGSYPLKYLNCVFAS
jgi:hypothetical protein